MIPLLLSVPGPIQGVRLADTDGDGHTEIVVASTEAGGGLTLTVFDYPEAGGRPVSTTHRLPAQAAWWDAGHGLWVQDYRGLRRLDGSVLAQAGSPLASLGPTTPVQAPLVVNLDHDSSVELTVWGSDALSVRGEDGSDWGTIKLRSGGELSVAQRGGGVVLQVAAAPPPVALADLDGSGTDDLVVIRDDALEVHFSQPGRISARQARWPLPALLSAPSQARDADTGMVSDVRWADLTGDGKADLLIHRIASDGRLTGTEAELTLLTGTGAGFSSPQVIRTGAGSQNAFPVDLDGDGDLDVLIPQIALAVGNLAQALISRSVEVTLVAHMMEDGRLSEAVPLTSVSLPLESDRGAAWSLFEDLDGDGLPDLAVAVEGRVSVYRGAGRSVASQPLVSTVVRAPVENLWAADLVGDGRAELVGWAPGATALVVVRSP